MIRYLIPRIPLQDVVAMLTVSVAGAMLAGGYGICHDQITYTISPEYFSQLKFVQFQFVDCGWPERFFVAEIGFLASWWVGFIFAWFLARRHLTNQPRWEKEAIYRIANAFAIVLAITAVSGIVGFAYGCLKTNCSDCSDWVAIIEQLEIADKKCFILVAYVHYFGYVGALIGFVAAITKPCDQTY